MIGEYTGLVMAYFDIKKSVKKIRILHEKGGQNYNIYCSCQQSYRTYLYEFMIFYINTWSGNLMHIEFRFI